MGQQQPSECLQHAFLFLFDIQTIQLLQCIYYATQMCIITQLLTALWWKFRTRHDAKASHNAWATMCRRTGRFYHFFGWTPDVCKTFLQVADIWKDFWGRFFPSGYHCLRISSSFTGMANVHSVGLNWRVHVFINGRPTQDALLYHWHMLCCGWHRWVVGRNGIWAGSR